jgi:hypothetical protein
MFLLFSDLIVTENKKICGSIEKVFLMIKIRSGFMGLMTHKYRGCIVVLLINKSVEPNEEKKVLTSGFDHGFSVNTSKRVFRGIW